MCQVIQLSNNMHVIRAVRAAINARASAIKAPDTQRRSAIVNAFGLIRAGSSAAWATAEASKALRSPAYVMRGATPPDAA